MSGRQENNTVNEGTVDQEFTVGDSDSSPTVTETVVKVKNLKTCANEKIDLEMANTVDTVKHSYQNSILTAIGNNITLKIDLAFRSKNASSEHDATSVMVSLE